MGNARAQKTDRWTETIDDLFEPLLQADDSLRQGLEGCTTADVARIETEFGHRLPAAFVALLGKIGRSRGALMPGADFGFPDLLGYRKVAGSLLSDQDIDLLLDERDFVFWMEQGYQFFFFRTGDSDDPPVLFYNDDDPAFVKVSDHLTDWLRVCVEEEVDLRTTARNRLLPQRDERT